jgi:hypothetical protein
LEFEVESAIHQRFVFGTENGFALGIEYGKFAKANCQFA